MKKERAWMEVDAQKLRDNYRNLCQFVKDTTCICVVKCNGYGHDAIAEANVLQNAGADWFATACSEEAISLRTNGITGNILILGHTLPAQMDDLWKYHLTQTVGDVAYGLALASYCRKNNRCVDVHLKIDTGMHRLGIRPDTPMEETGKLFTAEGIRVTGCFSHFATADSTNTEDVAFVYGQQKRFAEWLKTCREYGYNPGMTHISASAAIVNYPECSYEACRPGILLLGFDSGYMKHPYNRTPVMSLKSRIAKLDVLQPGETIGYGRTYTAKRTMRIATIPIGYGDGIPRNYPKGEVLIRGTRCPLVGRISMDQLCVDVTHLTDVCLFEETVIIGKQGTEEIRLSEMAEKAGTIANEIATKITGRIPRFYN